MRSIGHRCGVLLLTVSLALLPGWHRPLCVVLLRVRQWGPALFTRMQGVLRAGTNSCSRRFLESSTWRCLVGHTLSPLGDGHNLPGSALLWFPNTAQVNLGATLHWEEQKTGTARSHPHWCLLFCLFTLCSGFSEQREVPCNHTRK